MYLNRWVLLISCIAGVAGIVALADAFLEYRDTVQAYTQVDVAHDSGSVVWDDGNTRVTLQVIITNRSPATVTVEYLDLRLHADGKFAGADYDAWQPVTVASRASEQRSVTLEVSNSQLQDQFERAELSLRGEVRLRFAGVERPLTQRVSITLGRIASRSG
jgi:hypothetical protein